MSSRKPNLQDGSYGRQRFQWTLWIYNLSTKVEIYLVLEYYHVHTVFSRRTTSTYSQSIIYIGRYSTWYYPWSVPVTVPVSYRMNEQSTMLDLQTWWTNHRNRRLTPPNVEQLTNEVKSILVVIHLRKWCIHNQNMCIRWSQIFYSLIPDFGCCGCRSTRLIYSNAVSTSSSTDTSFYVPFKLVGSLALSSYLSSSLLPFCLSLGISHW
jgi:hypothetical protein